MKASQEATHVLGFAFNVYVKQLVLILKNKPDYQVGKLNGVGGRVENFDPTPLDAMVREFNEEADVETQLGNWQQFCTFMGPGLTDPQSSVACYTTILIPEERDRVNGITGEGVFKKKVGDLSTPRMCNLDWLIPMAICKLHGRIGKPLEVFK